MNHSKCSMAVFCIHIVTRYRRTFLTSQMTADCPPSRIVETSYGKVQGRRLIHAGDRQVDAFQGIPFAAPPVRELRFKKPQPPASWEGVKETKKFSARNIQVPFPGLPEDELHGVMSEDCLYLNVFTPCWEAPEKGFPVMVFIHGGAFVFGEASSYGDIGICENIVSREVVFVTIQYRLGYLGFLSTGDAVCPGNIGLWDQTEALKWVQANIGAFGGNKNNVTVLGQSAGSASVDLLHLSPHSTNLFHKAICMAGSAEHRWATRSSSIMTAQSIRKDASLGVTDFANSQELLDKLRLIPADKFAVSLFVAPHTEDHTDFETGPCLDGDFLPEPIDVLRAKATPKPLLNGVTKEEGLFLMPGRRPTAEGLDESLHHATLDIKNSEAMKKELCSRFVGDLKPEDPECMRAQAGMIADAMFVAGHVELCRKAVALQADRIYLYVFEHYSGPSLLGALAQVVPFQDVTHTNELFYLFKKGFFGDPEITETDKRVIDEFTTAFTNFAKYGNPNGCEDLDLPLLWKPITKKNPAINYVFTSDKPKMSNDLFEGRPASFIEIHNKHK